MVAQPVTPFAATNLQHAQRLYVARCWRPFGQLPHCDQLRIRDGVSAKLLAIRAPTKRTRFAFASRALRRRVSVWSDPSLSLKGSWLHSDQLRGRSMRLRRTR